jgi:predicted NBD/HSP70 family sugar kinase
MTGISRLLTGFGAGDLFQLLRDGRPRTRSELASETGFARSTIASRIDELLAAGLIASVGDAVSTGGRPSSRVALNATARLVAGADFGATHATVAVMDLSGDVLEATSAERLISSGPVESLDWLRDTVLDLMERLQRDPADLIAVGVGLPGPVEHATGRPTTPPIMPGWDGYDVPGHLRRTFSVPVLVDNDVNVMALGEQSKGWPDAQDMMLVKVATGIGSGIISGGALQRGADGSAGDIGHISVSSAAGVLCRCGNTGCLEAIAGAPAILRALADQGRDVPTLGDLSDRVGAGDLVAVRTLREAGRNIGEVLNMCVSLINPSLIVVGGAMSRFSDLLIAGIRESVYARAMPLATKNLMIVESKVGAQAGVIGAGMMAIEHALSPLQIDVTVTASAAVV